MFDGISPPEPDLGPTLVTWREIPTKKERNQSIAIVFIGYALIFVILTVAETGFRLPTLRAIAVETAVWLF